MLSVRERFESKVLRLPFVECWLWAGTMHPAGYGRIQVTDDTGAHRQVYAHRLAYVLYVGPIPDDQQVDHRCRIRLCVNPGHLEAVDQAENLRRTMHPLCVLHRENQCARGHDLTVHGYVRTGSRPGQRFCRLCATTRQRVAMH